MSSRVLPAVARDSIAACASAARSSGNRCPITGRSRPAAAYRASDGAADSVEHDVDAADGLAHPLGPLRPAVVDRHLGAQVANQRDLALAAGRRDDPRARRVRELDQQRAHAARRLRAGERSANIRS